jgi:hypothetical protein
MELLLSHWNLPKSLFNLWATSLCVYTSRKTDNKQWSENSTGGYNKVLHIIEQSCCCKHIINCALTISVMKRKKSLMNHLEIYHLKVSVAYLYIKKWGDSYDSLTSCQVDF